MMTYEVIAEQDHWTERGRATSVSNSDATDRPRRSVLTFADMRVLAIIALLLCTAITSRALSYGTPNSMAAQAMASNMDYWRETGKKVPQSWEEMDVLFARPVDEAFPYVLPTRRYAFVTNDVRIADNRLLLVMRSPFRDVRLYTAWYGGIAQGVRERGRWAIVQDSKSVIRARYFSEDIVVGAFASDGVSMPVPDGLGEWPHEVEYRRARNTKLAAGCLAFGLAIVILLARRAGRANKALQATAATPRS